MNKNKHNLYGERPSLDEQFACLSDTTRRRILTALADQDPRNEREFKGADFKPANVDPARFKIEVHHTHLPKLANAGFINWDRDSGTITRGPHFTQIRPLITLLTDYQDELPAEWP